MTEAEPVAIEVRALYKVFPRVVAVNNISFSVPVGQICGYLGPNGAGKTTTLRILSGMIRPDSGQARVMGYDVLSQPLEVKRYIGVVPESGAVYEALSPREYLQLVGRLHGLVESTIRMRMAELLELFGLTGEAEQGMLGFSRGMKQKVVIAAALLPNPKVLLLDEPLSGLDANSALVVKQLLRKLAQQGRTIFYCSHILDVVEKVCDRVIIINQGRIVADGSVSELKSMTAQSSLESVFRQLTLSEAYEGKIEDYLRQLKRESADERGQR
jgi:ABC-2 type transport system ATP-binding protein